MRHIQVEDGLRLRFPGRDEAFNEGVEIGLALAQMASSRREFTACMSNASVKLVSVLAGQLSYRVHIARADETQAEMVFHTGRGRPKLKLVHSSPALRQTVQVD